VETPDSPPAKFQLDFIQATGSGKQAAV